MNPKKIAGQSVFYHLYNTVIVGAGAAGMNCAVHLCEFMERKGIKNPQDRIAVITGGLALGASRMSGSDKQTYYKMGTGEDVADSASEFAGTLTTGGCCHGDLALIEAIGSLREFYHLVQVGVPFPTDSFGSFVGYKTDHDPSQRATSAGPRTSRMMSERLQVEVERRGIGIVDHQEIARLLTIGSATTKRIAGIVTLDKQAISRNLIALHVFLAANIVLACGGPGELYEASVYPREQVGIHGLAFKAGLTAENLTESQFGLASTKFRWNVSGSYMQAIPRIFSTSPDGRSERDFLADFFPTTGRMASTIFLKGYQWPFDAQRIENRQSSLIDILVFGETSKGRRVYLDFLQNPKGSCSIEPFRLDDLDPEAHNYLKNAGALEEIPLKRLEALNAPAIEIYRQNGIDLSREPLETALCSQHNNGGFAVNKWWESNIPRTFVIGEMAGTHGVKRPGGSALNAGQVGGLRAAEYIVNVYGSELPDYGCEQPAVDAQVADFITVIRDHWKMGQEPGQVISEIQHRMTNSAGHMRQLDDARTTLKKAVALYMDLKQSGLGSTNYMDVIKALRAEHIALASVAYLKAIVELLLLGSGSRGSHLVLAEDGIEIHPEVTDPGGKPLRFKPEHIRMRDFTLQIQYDETQNDLFRCLQVRLRQSRPDDLVFESAWRDYREGQIYSK